MINTSNISSYGKSSINQQKVAFGAHHGPTFTPGMPEVKNSPFYRFDRYTRFIRNSHEDQFLKQYLFEHFKRKNIAIPKEIKINVTSPLGLSPDIKEDINHVVFKDFKGFIYDLFKLLSLPKQELDQKVAALKVSPESKQKIYKIYDYIHNYYKIELTLKNKDKINLKKMTDDQKRKIYANYFAEHPEFANEIINISRNMKDLSAKFSLSEISRQTLFASGEAARGAVKEFVIGVLAIIGFDQFLVPPLRKLAESFKPSYGHAVENMTAFIAGFDDDTLGSLKDRHQDDIVLGKDNANKVLTATVIAGIALSLLALKFNPVAAKNQGKLKPAMAYAFLTAAGLFTSTALTFATMFKQVNNNIKNGLLDVPQKAKTGINNFKFKLKTAWNNFSSYDVYLGKVLGFLAVAPTVYIAHKSGALTSNSKLVKALALIMLGSVESYVATTTQLMRDKFRRNQIQSSKEIIVRKLAQPQQYNPTDLRVMDTNSVGQIKRGVGDFVNMFEVPALSLKKIFDRDGQEEI